MILNKIYSLTILFVKGADFCNFKGRYFDRELITASNLHFTMQQLYFFKQNDTADDIVI
jgi:hypothetical protein